MKLYLYGGAELDIPTVNPAVLKGQIKETLINLNPKSVLLVPFARLHPFEEEWREGWFKEEMSDTGIKILDARNENDINEADDSIIFINGGIERRELIATVNNNKKLLKLINTAQYIVAESAGSMIMGEYMRADRDGLEIIEGLGILKNTIIEPHYSEKKRQKLLIEDMQKSGMKCGIGIDCATAIVVDPTKFPNIWERTGVGNVEVMTG